MQYIIMLTIVLGMSVTDFLTGIIKGYVNNDLSSAKMRKGGLNKIAEILVMACSCGLEIGIKKLGNYYSAESLAKITGAVTAVLVFGYIVIMEIISILENYVEINSEARWARNLLKRLKNVNNDKEEEK
jgi:toxin secretion/phage lysis holin